jgi:tetratricopeptide (TPR) repeat protein
MNADGATVPAALSWTERQRAGEKHQARGELDRALECLIEARGLAKAADDDEAVSSLLGTIGEIQLEQGSLDQAIVTLNEALALDRAQEDAAGLAVVHRRLGNAHFRKGEPKRAKDAFREAERLLESLPVTPELEAERSRLHGDQAEIFETEGNLQKARDLLQRSLESTMRLNDLSGEALARRRLGSVLYESGEHKAASEQLAKAMELLERADFDVIDTPEVIEVRLLQGAILEDQGKATLALEHYLQALNKAEALKLTPLRAECLRRIGSAHAAKGEIAHAIEHYDLAIEIARRLDDDTHLSILYGDLGEVYLEQGSYDEAVRYFRNALDLDQEHQDRHGVAVAQRRLGTAYQEQGKFENAQEAYREAERLLEHSDDQDEKAMLHVALGALEEERAHYRNALERYERAMHINTTLRNDLNIAICLRHMASVKQQQGRLHDAEQDCSAALELLAGSDDVPERIEVFTLLGSILEDMGRAKEALAEYQKAFRLAERLNLPPKKSETLRRMGSAYAVRGDLLQAIERYEQAIEISRADPSALSVLHGDLGDVYLNQGNLNAARTAFKESLRLDQAQHDELGMARANRRLGATYQRLGDHDRADDFFRDAERLLENCEDDGESAMLYSCWGTLFEDQGQYTKSIDHFTRALDINEKQENSVGIAICQRHLGSALLRKGEVKEARRCVEAALDYFDDRGSQDRPEVVRAKVTLAYVLLAEGRNKEATELGREALRIAENIQHDPARTECLRLLGTANAKRPDHAARAIDRFEQALDISKGDPVMQAELLDDLGDALLQTGDVERAIEVYNAGLKRARRLDRNALTADILLGLVRCARGRGQLESVRTHLDEAKDIIEQFDASANVRAHLTLELAQLNDLEDRHELAVEHYELALKDFEASNDAQAAAECHRLLLSAYARSGDLARVGEHLAEALREEDPGILWSAVVLRRLDPSLAAAVDKAIQSGSYSGAVTDAFKVFELRLREVTQRSSGQTTKMRASEAVTRWFTAERRGLEPFDDPSELTHLADFARGAINIGRNRMAHSAIDVEPEEAFAWIGVAHLLLSYLEEPAEDEPTTS